MMDRKIDLNKVPRLDKGFDLSINQYFLWDFMQGKPVGHDLGSPVSSVPSLSTDDLIKTVVNTYRVHD